IQCQSSSKRKSWTLLGLLEHSPSLTCRTRPPPPFHKHFSETEVPNYTHKLLSILTLMTTTFLDLGKLEESGTRDSSISSVTTMMMRFLEPWKANWQKSLMWRSTWIGSSKTRQTRYLFSACLTTVSAF